MAVVLHVDDDPADAFLLKLALKRCNRLLELVHVSTGEEALAFLNSNSEGGNRPLVVVLDLDLPGMTGHEVLLAIKSSPSLRSTPVVVLSGSDHPTDLQRAYDAHVNAFFRKKEDFDEFCADVASLESFWRRVSSAPPPAYS